MVEAGLEQPDRRMVPAAGRPQYRAGYETAEKINLHGSTVLGRRVEQ
jgi:hypothetical protein